MKIFIIVTIFGVTIFGVTIFEITNEIFFFVGLSFTGISFVVCFVDLKSENFTKEIPLFFNYSSPNLIFRVTPAFFPGISPKTYISKKS